MSNDRFCTEHEATLISGVSYRTLLRFSEAGYLTVYPEPDGTRRYERAQVEEIFGMASSSAPAGGGYASVDPFEVTESKSCETRFDSTTHANPAQPIQTSHAASLSVEELEQGPLPVEKDISAAIRESQDVEEISRLRNLLSLQERILDSKDDEIADLRNQRAWLRERIEKLEEKSDRDQLLLLSETQTIRSLIAYQESRKSTFRQFLEWAGLYRAPSSAALPPSGDYHSKSAGAGSSSRTIEVSKAANSD